MRPSRPLAAAALLLATVVLAACGSRNAPTPEVAPAPAGESAPATTATPSPAAPEGTGGGSQVPDGPAPAACAATRGWGSGPRQQLVLGSAPLYLVRVGRHACYERVVVDLNGPDAVGYAVRYVPVVREDGSGTPRPVAGGAALELVVGAPALGLDDQGHQPGKVLAEPGAAFHTAGQLAGWRSLREVRYAGSFEGQTTIAVGVRERLPFRVFTVLDPRDQVRRVVLDVAR
jgi:hypothetical protein